jgi:hypothetical protein
MIGLRQFHRSELSAGQQPHSCDGHCAISHGFHTAINADHHPLQPSASSEVDAKQVTIDQRPRHRRDELNPIRGVRQSDVEIRDHIPMPWHLRELLSAARVPDSYCPITRAARTMYLLTVIWISAEARSQCLISQCHLSASQKSNLTSFTQGSRTGRYQP